MTQKKKILCIFMVLISCMSSINSFAGPVNVKCSVDKIMPKQLLAKRDRTEAQYKNKSWYMALCSATIYDNEDGTIGIEAQSLFYQPMAASYISITVEKLENGSWSRVWYGSFEKHPEDDPSGVLTDMILNFGLTNQPVNNYYRVLISHIYVDLNGNVETQYGYTEPIFLTNIN